MTPQELKRARKVLKLTQAQLEARLGLSANTKGRQVRRWEAGDAKIPGPAATLIKHWLSIGLPSGDR